MANFDHGGDLLTAQSRFPDWKQPFLDFSSNINPMGLPQRALEALGSQAVQWTAYPDPFCRELTAKLAAQERLPASMFLCANGAAELIYRLVYALRPRQALLVEPTFSEYEAALTSGGCQLRRHVLQSEQDFLPGEEILGEITPQTDLVFLCNPNNPTGRLVPPRLMLRILARCVACGALLAVDECFMDFVEEGCTHTLTQLTPHFPGLLLLKAFTKSHAMAGLRLGYCICGDRSLLERMTACGQPWSVCAPAQIAGLAALEQSGYLEESRRLVTAQRALLREGLEALGLRVIGGEANYLLFQLLQLPGEQRLDLRGMLEQQGILIRSCASYRGLDDSYYRIAVKGEEDNRRLLQALGGLLPQTKGAGEQAAVPAAE